MSRIAELKRRLVQDGGFEAGSVEVELVKRKTHARNQPFGAGMIVFHRELEYEVFIEPVFGQDKLDFIDLLLSGFEVELMDRSKEHWESTADMIEADDASYLMSVTVSLIEETYMEPDLNGVIDINGVKWKIKPKPAVAAI